MNSKFIIIQYFISIDALECKLVASNEWMKCARTNNGKYEVSDDENEQFVHFVEINNGDREIMKSQLYAF